MKKLFAVSFAGLTLAITSFAMAAPAASGTQSGPCSNCPMMRSQNTSAVRGASLDNGARPCHHGSVASARWGQAQKPCPHCTHSA